MPAPTTEGGNGVGEKIRTAALTEHINDFLTSSGESTHCTSESFTESAGVDVYATIGVEKL